jgi:hypothetical protein
MGWIGYIAPSFVATRDHSPIPEEHAVKAQRRAAVLARSREEREATAALRAEGVQAHRRARALSAQANVLLDSAVAIIEAVLARRGLALAEPVGAKFRTDELGSSGIEVSVRLEDPQTAAIARSAITERLGGESRSDSVIIA